MRLILRDNKMTSKKQILQFGMSHPVYAVM